MTLKFNPQIEIELLKLEDDGSTTPIGVDILPLDLNVHGGNKPVEVDISISRALGSVQDNCTITAYNAPIIEEIRRDFSGYLNTIRGQNWRVLIKAWYSDAKAAAEPDVPYVFIGDIMDDLEVTNQGLTDSALRITAHGHQQLLHSGKYKVPFPAETTYLEIVETLFTYMMDEFQVATKTIIQDEDMELEAKIVNSVQNTNRNPVELLNDICREMDFVWGNDLDCLYMLKRDEFFVDDQTPEIFLTPLATVSSATGVTSLVNFGKYAFSLESLWDNEFSPGKLLIATEQPQIGAGVATGRINSMGIKLNNYQGHSVSLGCQFVEVDRCVLEHKRKDFSGRRA